MVSRSLCGLSAILISACASTSAVDAADGHRKTVEGTLDKVVEALMQENGVPGMAVGIVTPSGTYVFNYGVVSKDTKVPVGDRTLFEIGSVSKTLTATLASYAQMKGDLSLGDSATKYVPALQGSKLDDVSLMNLGTHTSGGMPLQFPDDVTNDDAVMAYFKAWSPTTRPGTSRTYSNVSIGLFGLATAKAMGDDFASLMQGMLYPKLGLKHTYLDVPEAERKNYAQGYTKKDQPTRMTPGVLDVEAYGVRTTAADLARFVAANMDGAEIDPDLLKAIAATHTGYFKLGAMTQDLVWEQYAYPTDLEDLLAGNSNDVAYKPNPVTKIDPPQPPREDVWINKTGSTNGFGAYVAFVPERKLGIALLANRNYPNEARVAAAYRILTALAKEGR